MKILIVVDRTKNLPVIPKGVDIISAKRYLTDATFNEMKRVRVLNLCKSYRYQSLGYYVSLLGEARGHKPMPDISTLQDLKLKSVVRVLSEDFEEQIQRYLKELKSTSFTLSIYFGRNLAKRYDRLCKQLFNLFQVPLLRVEFALEKKRWQLRNVRPISLSEVPEPHQEFLLECIDGYFANRQWQSPKRQELPYDLAVLVNPEEANAPSDPGALRKFKKSAESFGMSVSFIDKNDYPSIAEYDALFIRETTAVNHHTYRFSRRAAAEGLVVIDDPISIVRCTNKVYLAELLAKNKIPIPKTLIVHKSNIEEIIPQLGLPVVLKQPDSSFSQGVTKVEDEQELNQTITKLLQTSELIVAQAFIKTEFDWRVGICDRKPLYVCKYFMARAHWQIIKRSADGRKSVGQSQTLRVEDAPSEVIDAALKAANLIGDGLYGVDIKHDGNQCYVIEVNDNPSIDASVEDKILKQQLYDEIMQVFFKRIEMKRVLGKNNSADEPKFVTL